MSLIFFDCTLGAAELVLVVEVLGEEEEEEEVLEVEEVLEEEVDLAVEVGAGVLANISSATAFVSIFSIMSFNSVRFSIGVGISTFLTFKRCFSCLTLRVDSHSSKDDIVGPFLFLWMMENLQYTQSILLVDISQILESGL